MQQPPPTPPRAEAAAPLRYLQTMRAIGARVVGAADASLDTVTVIAKG